MLVTAKSDRTNGKTKQIQHLPIKNQNNTECLTEKSHKASNTPSDAKRNFTGKLKQRRDCQQVLEEKTTKCIKADVEREMQTKSKQSGKKITKYATNRQPQIKEIGLPIQGINKVQIKVTRDTKDTDAETCAKIQRKLIKRKLGQKAKDTGMESALQKI